MKKFKPYIKPIILLTLGLLLMFLFRDKYKEFFFPEKEKKDFIVEFTTNYKSIKNDLLYNINENIDSYIVITVNKELNNFSIKNSDSKIVEIDNVKENSNIVLMINHNTYNSIITFNIGNILYEITTTKENNNLNINVKEKQE